MPNISRISVTPETAFAFNPFFILLPSVGYLGSCILSFPNQNIEKVLAYFLENQKK
jgi:hypothetical protein